MRTLAEIEDGYKTADDWSQLFKWIREMARWIDSKIPPGEARLLARGDMDRVFREIGPLDPPKAKRTINLAGIEGGRTFSLEVDSITKLERGPEVKGGGTCNVYAPYFEAPTLDSLEEVCAKIAESAKQPDEDTDTRSVSERMDEAIRAPLMPTPDFRQRLLAEQAKSHRLSEQADILREELASARESMKMAMLERGEAIAALTNKNGECERLQAQVSAMKSRVGRAFDLIRDMREKP